MPQILEGIVNTIVFHVLQWIGLMADLLQIADVLFR